MNKTKSDQQVLKDGIVYGEPEPDYDQLAAEDEESRLLESGLLEPGDL